MIEANKWNATTMSLSGNRKGDNGISFADDDGTLVLPPMESLIELRFANHDHSVPINLIVLMPQLKLPRFGDYTIDLALDANHLSSLPLMVRHHREPAPPSPNPQNPH